MKVCLDGLTIPEKRDKLPENSKDIDWMYVDDGPIECYWWTNASATSADFVDSAEQDD